jgi:hypothetical protein
MAWMIVTSEAKVPYSLEALSLALEQARRKRTEHETVAG